ncbi:hypothetical protein SanaruYs_15390 [Chryseotalea sanaruensis]|uniref:Uncharacterized protein n=1 Tax=Chryseotalea sanaruensis TaxID=2482724 RepID=A0A401U8U7_9BACT|nr:hypothetical protein [Chryseotalea sanaruensis]GCC51316.1 hypothetical protein SanaruYs_15390 [Chryseotalea sanaruensis]
MASLDQLQKEWLVVNATRELISIITGLPGVRYAKAISFAKEIDKELFKGSKTGLSKDDYFDKLYKKYVQEADIKKTGLGKDISAEKLIKKRFRDIDRLLGKAGKDKKKYNLLKKESDVLKTLIEQKNHFQSLNLLRLTENQAINNDLTRDRLEKVFIEQPLGKYSLFENVKDGSIFRITCLHPNPSEGVIGADLIYEQYDEKRKMVRIVAIQYKIWEHQTLYFSQSGNIGQQINNMKRCFCSKKYCVDHNGNKMDPRKYRLSYCMAFLKPTDKLQDPQKPITSGYHLPICKIDTLKEPVNKDYKLTVTGIKKQSIKASTFEELFDSEMLGSRWLKKSELEKFYRKNKVLDPSERIIVYAQGTKSME